MKNIWITGSRGFLGNKLLLQLKKDNEITCFTHNPKKLSFQNKIIQFDFLKKSDIIKLVEKLGLPDIFIHLGWSGMTDSESEDHLNFNVMASKNLIMTFFELGLDKFIFLGSRDEYGERKECLSEEDKSLGKMTKYALAKKIVANYGFEQGKKFGQKFLHIRLFNTYGQGQKENSLINLLYKGSQQNKLIHLGPCMHFRDFIHVSEACIGISLIMKIDYSTTINLGSGKAIRLKDFVNLFWKELGGKENMIIFESTQMRKNDPVYPESFADLKKLKKLTNWVPKLNIIKGIKMTIQELNSINFK